MEHPENRCPDPFHSALPRDQEAGGEEEQIEIDCRLLLKVRAVLIGADSMTSLVAHRYHRDLPRDVRDDLLQSSMDCRQYSDELKTALQGTSYA